MRRLLVWKHHYGDPGHAEVYAWLRELGLCNELIGLDVSVFADLDGLTLRYSRYARDADGEPIVEDGDFMLNTFSLAIADIPVAVMNATSALARVS